jgi:hypothetical protein
MNGLTPAILVLLGASAPLHAPDLQVEAVTLAGVGLPELADAVARALVASGARVVLRGPTSGPCDYCARVKVTEVSPGVCLVEVSQQNHADSTTLHLPAGSQLFDRARAIAIHARLLATWQAGPESRAKDSAFRPPRKSEVKASVLASRPAEPQPSISEIAPEPSTAPPRAEQASGGTVSASSPAVRPKPSGPMASDFALRDEGESVGRAEVAAQPRAESPATPVTGLAAARAVGTKPQWPWIPTTVGAGAAVAAGICALIARNRYGGLSDKTQPYESARSLKSSGENWQLASFILSGVAVAGLGTGIFGFVTRSSGGPPVTAAVTPVSGGGMVAIAGGLP